MPTSFLNLPSEVRNDIYEQTLVLEDPITCPTRPWAENRHACMLTPGLLLANKAICYEASSLLYAQNRFDFTMCDFEQMDLFLNQIGQDNASFIRHIIIDFPEFRCLDVQHVALDDKSITVLEKLRERCIRLSTITTSIYSTSAMELKLDALDCPKAVAEAMALVNSHFNSISSLQEVVVEVYEDGSSDYIRKEMKGNGWTISETECFEETDIDRYFWDSDYDDHSFDGIGIYDDENDTDNEYDIDNDSDFWRRAGD